VNPELFREGTSDENIHKSVVEFNEYRIPERFETDDLILDIGAHVGNFAYACTQRGAGRVMCFEPDPENYALLRQHLEDEIAIGRVETFPVAVSNRFEFRWFSGPILGEDECNHGGAYLFGRNNDSYGLGPSLLIHPYRVVTIAFDDIEFPDGFNRRLLKLDCERSEHEIIQSASVASFPQIAGEYHPCGDRTGESLKARLEQLGFAVGLFPWRDSELGLFFCRKTM